MRSASRDRRAAALGLAGLALFLAVFYSARRSPKPQDAADVAGLPPPAPSAAGRPGRPVGSAPSYTNDELQKMLQRQTSAMGIDRIVSQEDEELPQSFLGDKIGRPETRRQAESVIRRLAAMRQSIEAGSGKAQSVPISGETVPVLAKTDPGGGALESSADGRATAQALESSEIVAGIDGSWSGSFAPGEPGQHTIRDEKTWRQLWPNYSHKPAPEVDFSKRQLGVILLGLRPTGGYKVRVVETRLTPAHLLIRWKETAPPPGKTPPAGQTAPFTIQSVPRTDLPVRFEKIP